MVEISAHDRKTTRMFPDELIEDLVSCVNCGMCLQVCPTYKATRQEAFSPRGRAQVIKHYASGELGPTKPFQQIVSSCLQCGACTKYCVSGVRIERIISHINREMYPTSHRGLRKRILPSVLCNNTRLKVAANIARLGQKLVDTLKIPCHVGNIPLAKLPKFNQMSFRQRAGAIIAPEGKRQGKVAYFTGCATDLVYDDVGSSVVNILAKLGLEVWIPPEQMCCAAPLLYKGAWQQALRNIMKNIETFDCNDVDAIVVDCGTCGAALKKVIPELLEALGMNVDRVKRIAAKVKDISQIVCERIDSLPMQKSAAKELLLVTYHDPCHLARGMGVVAEPRKILQALSNVKLVEMEGADECCGGAGGYQFEQGALSGEVTSRKMCNIRETGARIIATGCPSCRLTMTGHLHDDQETEVMHTAQLVSRCLDR